MWETRVTPEVYGKDAVELKKQLMLLHAIVTKAVSPKGFLVKLNYFPSQIYSFYELKCSGP